MDLAAAVFDFDEASESECLVRKTKVSPCTACRTDAGSKRRKSSSTPDALKTWDWARRLLDVLQGDSTFCKYETVNLFYRVHWQCLCRERGGVGNQSSVWCDAKSPVRVNGGHQTPVQDGVYADTSGPEATRSVL